MGSLLLEVTYRDNRSEIIEIQDDKPLQDLREYFNAESVALLKVYRQPTLNAEQAALVNKI